MGKVFISYSHDSPEHADKVLAFSNRLRKEGVDCILDQYEESPPEGWPRWMDKHIRDGEFVLMICTETYYKRVMGEEEPGKGLGVRWEGNLIYQHIYNTGTHNTRFIPVLFENGKTEHIATPLQNATRYWVDTEEGYKQLYRRLTGQLRVERPELGEIIMLPSLGVRERKQDFFAPRMSNLTAEKIIKIIQIAEELKKLKDSYQPLGIRTPGDNCYFYPTKGGVGLGDGAGDILDKFASLEDPEGLQCWDKEVQVVIDRLLSVLAPCRDFIREYGPERLQDWKKVERWIWGGNPDEMTLLIRELGNLKAIVEAVS